MNPIVGMMKRYIKMPLKYALPLLFICALVLSATTGCTTNTDTRSSLSNGSNYQNTGVSITPSASTPSASASSGGADKSQMLTSDFSKNYDIVTPFTKTVSTTGEVVYKAAVKDKSGKLDQYKKEISIYVTVNAAQTKQKFATLKQQWQAKGYNDDYNWEEQFYGQTASEQNKAFDKTSTRVYLNMQEPDSIGVFTGYGTYAYTLGEFNVLQSYDTKIL